MFSIHHIKKRQKQKVIQLFYNMYAKFQKRICNNKSVEKKRSLSEKLCTTILFDILGKTCVK